MTVIVRASGFPQDRWITVLGVVPVEPAHLPQYASLFAIGLLAARGGWLTRLPTWTGMVWLAVGLALAAARYLWALVAARGPDPTLWAVWEAFLCVGSCVGLPVLFRERVRIQGRLMQKAQP
ncbi:MAG TPA: hypothetical protein VGK33_14385 [Chloroflexota bacterium]